MEDGKLKELRNPLDMALQYQDIFKVSSDDMDLPLGMKISYEAMKDILNDFSQDTVKLLRSFPEEDLSEIEDEAGRQSDIQNVLSRMFSSLTEGYLIPNEHYDLIIDTSASSPSVIVEMIHRHFLEWKKEGF